MLFDQKRKTDSAEFVRAFCGGCFRVLDPAAEDPSASGFKRCVSCGRIHHAACVGDHCPAISCSGGKLEPVPPGAIPRPGRLDTRKRVALPATPPEEVPSSIPPVLPPPVTRAPHRLRRRLFGLICLSALCLAAMMADCHWWPDDPAWLASVNERRLHARVAIAEKVAPLVIQVRSACDHVLEWLDSIRASSGCGNRAFEYSVGQALKQEARKAEKGLWRREWNCALGRISQGSDAVVSRQAGHDL